MEKMKVKWIKLLKSGDIEKETSEETELPSKGDGKFLGDTGFEVVGYAHTPHLDCEYHIFVSENN